MLSSLYGFLSDPDTFDRFLQELEVRFDALEARAESNEPFPENPEQTAIDHHFKCAAEIFDKIGLQAKEDLGAAVSPVPVFVLDARAAVVEANPPATALFGVNAGDSMASLTTDTATDRSLGEDIRRLLHHDGEDLIVTLGAGEDGDAARKLYTLSKIPGGTGGPRFHLTAIDLSWHGRAGASVGYSFGLTTAEQEILRGIVEGKDFPALAKERGRSLQTIRTQAKSLLRKTGARNQAGLVRLFAAISISQSATDARRLADTSATETVMLTLDDGRRLQVDLAGPVSGEPILLLHGLFSGTGLSADTQRYLKRERLRVIAPWRPGYAGSTPHEGAQPADPDCFAGDLEQVLDHFGLSKAHVMGRFTGAIYAAAAARKLPHRVKACAMVSSTAPIRHKRQLQVMRGWQKLFAYAICYFPATVPMLVRGMHQFLFRKETAKFLEGFYGEPERDLEIRMHPGIVDIIEKGVAQSFQQGPKAHEQDLMLTGSDWSHLLRGINCPVLFLHGEGNPVDPVDQIRDIVGEFSDFALRTFPGEGQLFVHWRPDLVFGTFLDHLETRNRTASERPLADA